jgi:Kef-type K+ transport system membrane component KefB
MALPAVTAELGYVGLLFALFVLPRVLQRYRVPTAITSFALGAGLAMTIGLFAHDPTVELLSTFGIVSLFLFAGLEVELPQLRKAALPLIVHLLFRLLSLAAVGWIVWQVLGIGPRAAALVALALLTPSTGFILDSLHAFGLNEQEEFWVRSKAISSEIVALGVLFVVLQSESASRLAGSAVILGLVIALLPVAFHWFAKWVRPYAPKSEFAFLIMISVICAIITRELGVYYLVGAFIVGMAAQRFRAHLPAMASEQMLHAVESFASLFVPFYFFHAGLTLHREDFGWQGLLTGAVFIIIGIPLRVFLVSLQRRTLHAQSWRDSLRISVPLLPTLVFTLVLVSILRDRFDAPSYLIGGLVVYTIVNTMIPGIFLRAPTPEFDTFHIPGEGDQDTSLAAHDMDHGAPAGMDQPK